MIRNIRYPQSDTSVQIVVSTIRFIHRNIILRRTLHHRHRHRHPYTPKSTNHSRLLTGHTISRRTNKPIHPIPRSTKPKRTPQRTLYTLRILMSLLPLSLSLQLGLMDRQGGRSRKRMVRMALTLRPRMHLTLRRNRRMHNHRRALPRTPTAAGEGGRVAMVVVRVGYARRSAQFRDRIRYTHSLPESHYPDFGFE